MTLESEIKLVQRLVRMMEKGDVSELELEDSKGGMRVHIKRGPQQVAGAAAPVVHFAHASPGAEGPAPSAPAGEAPAPAEAAAAPSSGTPFLSPMVGTFYRSASPEAEPFVSVGTDVSDDSVVCIIEAMKVMNEIKAETRGRVTEILVENGEPVEYGQPLFMLEPA